MRTSTAMGWQYPRKSTWRRRQHESVGDDGAPGQRRDGDLRHNITMDLTAIRDARTEVTTHAIRLSRVLGGGARRPIPRHARAPVGTNTTRRAWIRGLPYVPRLCSNSLRIGPSKLRSRRRRALFPVVPPRVVAHAGDTIAGTQPLHQDALAVAINEREDLSARPAARPSSRRPRGRDHRRGAAAPPLGAMQGGPRARGARCGRPFLSRPLSRLGRSNHSIGKAIKRGSGSV